MPADTGTLRRLDPKQLLHPMRDEPERRLRRPAGRLEGIPEVARQALPQRPGTARTDVDAITLEPGCRRAVPLVDRHGHARLPQPLRQAKSAEAPANDDD